MSSRTVIVTGAGGGLGKGIAERLARDGFAIAVVDIDKEAADAVASDIEAAGGAARAYSVDVSDPEGVEAMVAKVEQDQPTLFGVVNNAGIGRATPFLDVTLTDWQRIVAVNETGTFLLSQAVLRRLVPRRAGVIVNMSSIAGKDAWPNWVHYAATKHAVIGLTRGLAREFGSLGIRVNAICPGAIKTAIWSAEAQATSDPDAAFDELVSRSALGRGQTIEEVAAAASFLVGDESASITGVSLSVDSGMMVS